MKTMMRGVTFAAILTASCAQAGMVEQVEIAAQTQMTVEGGVLKACGYDLVVVSGSRTSDDARIVPTTSFSIHVDDRTPVGISIVKGGVFLDPRVGKPFPRPIKAFWMKANDARATKPLTGKTVPAEIKGYLAYVEEFEMVMRLFQAVWNREVLTVGVQINGEVSDRIYAGVVKVPDADIQQNRQCLKELGDQMQRKRDALVNSSTGR